MPDRGISETQEIPPRSCGLARDLAALWSGLSRNLLSFRSSAVVMRVLELTFRDEHSLGDSGVLPCGVCSTVISVTDARTQLIDHISAEAVFHGDFTLTSGKKASYYIDLRRVSLDHRVAPLIGQVMVELIQDVPDVAAVGGLTMGADPIASAVLHQGVLFGKEYDAFVVRKAPKDHGRGRQVEGPDLEGKRVIVLEDTSTTGGSPLAAIEALLKVGAEIAAVAVVVDRDTGAREIIEAAGYPYLFAIGLDDLGLRNDG